MAFERSIMANMNRAMAGLGLGPPQSYEDEGLNDLVQFVVPGRPLPPSLASPPWRLPSGICQDWQKINLVLTKSVEIQSSRIPNDSHFDQAIMGNGCLIISGMLQYYLKCLNLYESDLVYGMLTGRSVLICDTVRRAFIQGGENSGIPHAWLDINDCPIDNTYR